MSERTRCNETGGATKETLKRRTRRTFLRPGVLLTKLTHSNLRLCRQAGAETVVLTCPSIDEDISKYLSSAIEMCRNSDLTISVIERFLPHDKIVHGKPGADVQISYVKTLIREMGRLNIPVLCYNWMPRDDWTRTSKTMKERGGALVTAFDESKRKKNTLTLEGNKSTPTSVTSADSLWNNLKAFLQEVLPCAEKNNVVLAMHPDDPPLKKLGRHPQIIYSVEQLLKVTELVKSPSNGVCFCQGTFASAGEDIPKSIRRLGKRIKFVHFRDVVVDTPGSRFREAWQDSGDTNMFQAMRAYREAGLSEVTIRPDHVPTMEGESNEEPGYHVLGRLFALGYIRGLMEAVIELSGPTRLSSTREPARSVKCPSSSESISSSSRTVIDGRPQTEEARDHCRNLGRYVKEFFEKRYTKGGARN